MFAFIVALVWLAPSWLGQQQAASTRPPALHAPALAPSHPPPALRPSPLSPASRRRPIESEDRMLRADNLPLALPGSAAESLPPELVRLQAEARASNTATAWRALADAAARLGQHRQAAEAYMRESAIYARTDMQASEAERMKAESHQATLALYHREEATAADRRRLYTGARLEPQTGCYLGAFIDHDDELPWHLEDGRRHGDVARFEELTGRPHASYFSYLSYGMPFPTQWVADLRAHDAVPHIAWEPDDIRRVQDDDYLRTFAAAARDSHWPIFIRFAGEMNGDWTPYHADPAAYRRAFAIVHRAFRDAPNVAVIWCPNAIPLANLDAWYPGDENCDWVGVNFYNVLYLDDDPKNPGDRIHPTDLLDPIYQRYSSRKPIAICEYAATHQSHLDPQPRPEYAARRMQELYAALVTRYPRVKLVDWYDCNNMAHARPGRRLNNYLLTDEPQVLDAYRDATEPSWFLNGWQGPEPPFADRVWKPLTGRATLARDVVLRATLRCWTNAPRMYFLWDGQVVHATSDPRARGLHLHNVALGSHLLRVVVQDEQNRPVASRQYRSRIQ